MPNKTAQDYLVRMHIKFDGVDRHWGYTKDPDPAVVAHGFKKLHDDFRGIIDVHLYWVIGNPDAHTVTVWPLVQEMIDEYKAHRSIDDAKLARLLKLLELYAPKPPKKGP